MLIHQNETCFGEFAPADDETPRGGINLWDVTDPRNPQNLAMHAGDYTEGSSNTPKPHASTVHPPYRARFEALKKEYPGARLLIVSNTAGTSDDATGSQLRELEANTGVRVLAHSVKKPGCRDEIFRFYREDPEGRKCGVTRPDQIAVVGDRLLTDVMMANLMGARGVWVRDGVLPKRTFWMRAEGVMSGFLWRRWFVAPEPRSDFE